MPLAIETDHPPLRIDEHGNVRIGQTRVTLQTLVYAYQDGSTAEQIALQYPSLSLADIHAVIAYYLRHTPQVDAYLAEQRRDAEEVRRKIESNSDMQQIRQRLLARKAETDAARRG